MPGPDKQVPPRRGRDKHVPPKDKIGGARLSCALKSYPFADVYN